MWGACGRTLVCVCVQQLCPFSEDYCGLLWKRAIFIRDLPPKGHTRQTVSQGMSTCLRTENAKSWTDDGVTLLSHISRARAHHVGGVGGGGGGCCQSGPPRSNEVPTRQSNQTTPHPPQPRQEQPKHPKQQPGCPARHVTRSLSLSRCTTHTRTHLHTRAHIHTCTPKEGIPLSHPPTLLAQSHRATRGRGPPRARLSSPPPPAPPTQSTYPQPSRLSPLGSNETALLPRAAPT